MSLFRLTEQMKEMIAKAKLQGGTLTCDPRAMYPAGHKCAATTQPVNFVKPYIKLQPTTQRPPDAIITKSVPLQNGGAVTTFDSGGESVTAVTDANGDVKKVEVKDNKMLYAAAAIAAFFLLGG